MQQVQKICIKNKSQQQKQTKLQIQQGKTHNVWTGTVGYLGLMVRSLIYTNLTGDWGWGWGCYHTDDP